MTTTTRTTEAKNDAAIWDTTHDSRETFSALLQAQCAPGQAVGPVPTTGRCADAALDSAAAVLLTLLDHTTSLAIESMPSEDFDWLYAATGAPTAPVAQADFVLSTQDLGGVIAEAKCGTAEQPEHGATVLFARNDPTAVQITATISGPGIEHPRTVAVPMSAAAMKARAVANVAYPMGVDVIITGDNEIVAFPRSTQISMEGAGDVRGNA